MLVGIETREEHGGKAAVGRGGEYRIDLRGALAGGKDRLLEPDALLAREVQHELVGGIHAVSDIAARTSVRKALPVR